MSRTRNVQNFMQFLCAVKILLTYSRILLVDININIVCIAIFLGSAVYSI